jgi:ATP-binding cassette, subfamily B, bacterial PglK
LTPRFWRLLTARQRRGGLVLLGLMVVGMVLETLGVGIVLPVLTVLTQDDLAQRYPRIAPLLVALGSPTQAQLAMGSMIALAGLYTLKTVFLAYLAFRQARYAAGIQMDLSQQLFGGYLRQPYVFHLRRNSAELIRNVTEVAFFVSTLRAGMMLLTELLVVVGVVALLLVVEPFGSLLVGLMVGLSGWLFHHVTRKRLTRWGEERQAHEGLRIQHLFQGLSGAKDLKLLGREADVLGRFRTHNSGSIRLAERLQFLQQLPRLWLELLAVLGLVALVLVIVAQGKPLAAIVPTLAVFAVAAFRLMPSVSRILGSLQTVRYSAAVVKTLDAEFRGLAPPAPAPGGPPVPFRTELRIDGVTFTYPGSDTPALRDLSMVVPRGRSIGIIGASGAGKSTLVDIMLGLIAPDQGVLTVDGVDVQKALRSWQDQIGYVPQSIYLTDDTLRRNVAFGLGDDQIEEAAVWRALRAAQLDAFVDDLRDRLETPVGERGVRLSGGQRQRVGIARALYHEPAVLVLDEATSSLDTTTEKGVIESVRALRGDKTIIIVAHRLSTVQHCDLLYRIEDGILVDHGEPRAVIAKAEGATA